MGQTHLLQPVGQHLVGALERGELPHGVVELGLEGLDPLHPLGGVARDRLELLGVLAHDGDAPRLVGQPRQLLGERAGLLAHAPHLRRDRRRALAGGVQDGEAGLALLHGAAQVRDPLAHGMQAAVLELEAIAALPHLLPKVHQRLASALLCRFRLLLRGLELLGPGHHLAAERLHVGDPGLDGGEPPDLLLLPAEPGVELAVHARSAC